MTRAEFLAALRRHFGLHEAVTVSDSFEALRSQLEDALNQWPGRPAENLGVLFTFSDRLIAYSWRSDSDREAWEVPWQHGEDGYIFGAPSKVERVVRFEPVGESHRGRKGKRIVERVEQTLTLLPLHEARTDGSRPVKAIGITADVVNGNGRRYARAVLAAALADLNGHLHESAGQGRLILTGEAEHPSDKSTGRPNILETVVKWEAAYLQQNGQVGLEGVILPTAKGKDILVLVENGVPLGVSQRAYGVADLITENGQTIEDVRELRITGYDFVSEPSDPFARLLEAQQQAGDEEQDDETDAGEDAAATTDEAQAQHMSEHEETQEPTNMNLEELLKLLSDKPELREALLGQFGAEERKKLAESLGVEADKLEEAVTQAMQAQQELTQRKQQEAIDTAITEACQDLKYGAEINAEFVDAVRATQPATPDAVKGIVESKRKEYDAIMSKAKLATMGKHGIEVKGPVFERETGQPEYTHAAFAINESLVKAGQGHRRDLGKAEFGAELFASRYLELYDEQFRRQLTQEAKLFGEAETTSDLDLPYSVMRTIVQQAFPELVAANVFDFSTTDQSPARLYFEKYQGESGSTASVTDEDVVADLDAWVNLATARLQPGTVVVTNDDGSTTYAEGDDYVIDYGKGRLRALSAGAITASQALKVDYTYDAIRKGEMQPIERAKQVLSHKMLEIAADRLATQISSEAIVFSRSQLGYDAVTRTLAGLVRQIRIKIDRDIFYLALAASLQQPNNSGGSWNSASDTLDKLVEYVGYAKVKVYNRYYTPTGIIMSKSNADVLSNWSGFKRDGYPNAVINAAGFAGSVKALPIWSTTEFPDSHILTPNRELVMHRVFQAMQLKGPFPSFQDGKLLAADQYYAEEYNGTDVPVVEKVAHVAIN